MYDYEEHKTPWNSSKVKTLVIKNGVTSIGDNAFSYTNIKSATIPSSVKEIGVFSFGFARYMKSVKIGKNVTLIGDEAFNLCASLKSVTIPDKV